MPNSAFTVDDLCRDPNFIGWVLHPTEESDQFWRTFISNYPHKANDIQQAIDHIQTFQFKELDPNPADLARLKQRIWNDIDRTGLADNTDPSPIIIQRNPWYRQPYWAAAAVVLLVSAVVVGWWRYQASAGLTYRTDAGRVQAIRLADGSMVTLNANSSLKVADNLAGNPTREVWLEGEAYFDIAKQKGARFIVHTSEASVEVLGTEFNVNARRKRTQVVLQEGKVQLSTPNQSAVVMQPGDMAIVLPQSRQIQLKRVQPEQYEVWKKSYIILDGKSLPDIINNLEDLFGVEISLTDSALVNRKLTGKLRTEAVDECLENLGIILDATVKKSENTYQFD